MQFECPHCQQSLIAEPSQEGQLIACPSCSNTLIIPKGSSVGKGGKSKKSASIQLREGWAEADASNPNILLSLAIGAGGLFLWYGLLFPFKAAASVPTAEHTTMNWIASLFYGHLAVSMLNTLFFFWAMAILILKMQMLKHQQAALLLDVLPRNLGNEITGENVGTFINHLYALPEKLRDSMMVNRIRKGLEFFEIRQNSGEVREMMSSQSDIDAARIMGSFILLRAFLWAIPLLGFIGTVIGLSHAIGGMNFSNVSDVSKVVEAINNVTSGLGTAFDATLLGLVLAMTLNFPLNSLVKQEDDNLSNIDAFCNEVLLPRLVDSHDEPEERHEQPAAVSDGALVEIFKSSQREFLEKLESLSNTMGQQAASIDQKMADFMQSLKPTESEFLKKLESLSNSMGQQAANIDQKMAGFMQEVSKQLVAKSDEMRAESLNATKAAVSDSLAKVNVHVAGMEGSFTNFNKSLLEISQQQINRSDKSFEESLNQSKKYLSGLEAGINSLNAVLKNLDGKQVMITVKKKGWFSRN